MEQAHLSDATSDSPQKRAYDLLIKVSTGLHGLEVILHRLQEHLKLSGFPVVLKAPRDVLNLSDEAAEAALRILPKLYRPSPDPGRVASLL